MTTQRCIVKKVYSTDCCGKEVVENDRCEEHHKQKCCSCEALITRHCNYCGQFVCGAPLCDNCGETYKKSDYGNLYHSHGPKGNIR